MGLGLAGLGWLARLIIIFIKESIPKPFKYITKYSKHIEIIIRRF